MPHHIYHTPALVVASIPRGEADAVVELFTEDLGYVMTHARGIRKESSRLRYVVQPMSWIVANIVRGTRGWRLTTATPYDVEGLQGRAAQSLSRVMQIVRKFLPNESVARFMFTFVQEHHRRLLEDDTRRSEWEVRTLAHMFHHLGYWGIDIPAPIIKEISPEKNEAYTREINRILRTVHT
jgi:recombinational DNA repair protein (RecF pathway)